METCYAHRKKKKRVLLKSTSLVKYYDHYQNELSPGLNWDGTFLILLPVHLY